MAVYTVRTRDVMVLGHIWQPWTELCAMHYTLPKDVDATREAIQNWLDTHAGDFSHIVDFAASIEDVEIPWSDEDNEMCYNDIMFGGDE